MTASLCRLSITTPRGATSSILENTVNKTLLALTMTIVFANTAYAQNIAWDERVDGNLSDDPYVSTPINFRIPTIFPLLPGVNVVRGSTFGTYEGGFPGPAPEGAMSGGYDIARFQLTPEQEIVSITITRMFTPADPSNTVGINLLRNGTIDELLSGDPDVLQVFGASLSTDVIGTNLLEFLVTDPITDGDFFFEMREFDDQVFWEVEFIVEGR